MITTTRTRNSSTSRSRPFSVAKTLAALSLATAAVACGGMDGAPHDAPSADAASLHGTIGTMGGELVGAPGTAFEGVRLTFPPGALAADTEIRITAPRADVPLPATAVRCGPELAIEPAGLSLAFPATLTLPFDAATVSDNLRFEDQVKVWVLEGDHWGQREQLESAGGAVTVQVSSLTTMAAGVNPPSEQDVVRFDFAVNPKFASCLSADPTDPTRAPHVSATVVRGSLNDGLFLQGKYLKPGLAFDMFTVENSALGADGKPAAGFTSFGLAWYQSDLEAKSNGTMRASIRTILLDQIFGFDPTVSLPPTGTFNVGFWFNKPEDAVACGFDATKPTPFNGDHKAGPLAMITLPNATTGLGPLCTKPDTSVTPARCSP